jgi:hypothetical protein
MLSEAKPGQTPPNSQPNPFVFLRPTHIFSTSGFYGFTRSFLGPIFESLLMNPFAAVRSVAYAAPIAAESPQQGRNDRCEDLESIAGNAAQKEALEETMQNPETNQRPVFIRVNCYLNFSFRS